ncbi:type IV secretion system protein virB10 [Candidatus Phycosocius bacilliformis]|uniref:Type IV secretion system protein virB10 n=1 Tax=Candidatus Phycosocius bacilliformis TaxID=1445552 RepID=A0A2P2E6Z3_9PROT|nr:TrbI/VirB10 family protein [Candidatus Phycosocius bacilliformis]GBF56827.1 type IV secretion system protein virB10 [Candidatus Phycosocius bacilliformis]
MTVIGPGQAPQDPADDTIQAEDGTAPLPEVSSVLVDATPSVAYPDRPWVVMAGAIGALALGAIVFTTMVSAQKRAGADDVSPTRDPRNDGMAGQAVPEAPNLFAQYAPTPVMPPAETVPENPAANEVVPPSPPPPPPPLPPPAPIRDYYRPLPVAPPPPPVPARTGPDLAQRMRSPALIVDLTPAPAPDAAPGAAMASGSGDNDAFAARVSSGEAPTARAGTLRNPKTTVPQGALIAAVLETAINSDLPGFVRAVVSRDVLSFDGSRVLIPRGSRLVGQYRSEVALGQSRAFVVWTRLLRPDGVSIQLASPGTDTLGRAGLDGKVDRHYLQRYGPGLLSTAISAGLSRTTSNQLVIGTAQTLPGAMSSGEAIKPTVTVKQGTAIQVFVARDLDFSLNPVAALAPPAVDSPAPAGNKP